MHRDEGHKFVFMLSKADFSGDIVEREKKEALSKSTENSLVLSNLYHLHYLNKVKRV